MLSLCSNYILNSHAIIYIYYYYYYFLWEKHTCCHLGFMYIIIYSIKWHQWAQSYTAGKWRFIHLITHVLFALIHLNHCLVLFLCWIFLEFFGFCCFKLYIISLNNIKSVTAIAYCHHVSHRLRLSNTGWTIFSSLVLNGCESKNMQWIRVWPVLSSSIRP